VDSVRRYVDVQMAVRSIGGGDWKWLCMLRVQTTEPLCMQQLPCLNV